MMKKYRKSSYIMGAERVSPGRELYNYLEDCSYITSAEKCIRLIGTVGEEWTVTIDKLVKTYTYEDGTPITPENIPEKGVFDITPIVGADADVVFAELATRQVEVTTSWGESLKLIVMGYLMELETTLCMQTKEASRILTTNGLLMGLCLITHTKKYNPFV